MTNPYRAMCAELIEELRDPQNYADWEDIEELKARARALLAEPEAVGPGDEDLVEALRRLLIWPPRSTEAACEQDYTFARAVLARWGRPTPQPVAVSERLPGPNVKVLAYYFNALGNGRTICAVWVPAKSRSDEGDLDADDFLEYDEEGDKYYWPEGWYEAIENWDELGWAKVYEGEIVYWQPLPKWPADANALPTPEATNA